MLRNLALNTAVIVMCAQGASAAVIDVTISGTTEFFLGGPYAVSGGFSWDSEAFGASVDPSAVSITDPGISGFSVAFTGGLHDQTFSGNTLVAGGLSGSFDLSRAGMFSDIVNDLICLEGSSGDGTCDTSNPSGGLSFNENGSLFFSPASITDNSVEALNITFSVSERGPAPVPLPAALPLLLLGLAGIATMRLRNTGKHEA